MAGSGAWLWGAAVLGLAIGVALAATPAGGQGSSPLVPIGQAIIQQGLRVAAGYLPGAVAHEASTPAVEGVLLFHLQLDVDGARGNPYGFDPDESVPYLRVPFRLTHEGSGRSVNGVLAPMVSRDGFHYGANVSVPGPGNYTLSVDVRPPEGLARHTDPRTGVAAWWSPFTLTWTFRYPE